MKNHNVRTGLTRIAPLAAVLAITAGAAAQAPPELFLPGVEGPHAPFQPEFTPVRAVTIDEHVFKGLIPGATARITLDEGTVYTITVDSSQQRTPDLRVVTGNVTSTVPGSAGRVTFVRLEDATVMQLHMPAERRIYRLQYLPGGSYEVCLVDDTNEPLCDGGRLTPPTPPRVLDSSDDDWRPERGPDGEDPAPGFGGGCSEGTPMIDVWVLYTPAARDADGSDSVIRADGALAVELANEAYANSGVSQRMRLVRCTLISYTEGSGLDVDLDRLTDTSDGIMDSVHATRDTINADLVSLFTNTGSGLGWCVSTYDYGFSCVKWSRATSTYSLAHETGHNMGCAHDRANADCGPAYNYGYGYTWVGDDSNTYSSVMSYGAGRITHFSNPNITYQGVATGVATSSASSAYNTLVINNRDRTVEDFELTRWDTYVDHAYGGPFFLGTYPNPANSFALGVAFVAVPETGAGDVPNLYVRGDDSFVGTVSKEMTIIPCGGAVTIGN